MFEPGVAVAAAEGPVGAVLGGDAVLAVAGSVVSSLAASGAGVDVAAAAAGAGAVWDGAVVVVAVVAGAAGLGCRGLCVLCRDCDNEPLL